MFVITENIMKCPVYSMPFGGCNWNTGSWIRFRFQSQQIKTQ